MARDNKILIPKFKQGSLEIKHDWRGMEQKNPLEIQFYRKNS